MFKESAASGASDDVHFDGDDSDAPGTPGHQDFMMDFPWDFTEISSGCNVFFFLMGFK